jgi:hypothetical protein
VDLSLGNHPRTLKVDTLTTSPSLPPSLLPTSPIAACLSALLFVVGMQVLQALLIEWKGQELTH